MKSGLYLHKTDYYLIEVEKRMAKLFSWSPEIECLTITVTEDKIYWDRDFDNYDYIGDVK